LNGYRLEVRQLNAVLAGRPKLPRAGMPVPHMPRLEALLSANLTNSSQFRSPTEGSLYRG
jgi:hypothetical protein